MFYVFLRCRYFISDLATAKFCADIDTVLINVSGRLIMLNPVRNEAEREDSSSEDDENHFQVRKSVIIFWLTFRKGTEEKERRGDLVFKISFEQLFY